MMSLTDGISPVDAHGGSRYEIRGSRGQEYRRADEFIRLWDFYLTYCESAFLERAIGDVQLHAIKPGARPAI